MKRDLPAIAWLVVALPAVPGCTAEQFYAGGRDWQRSQCATILDATEYERCMRDADIAYEEYRKRKEAETNASPGAPR